MTGGDQELASQQVRRVSYEGDALRLAMDWSISDLSRPQVLVETAGGSSHPSSFHLSALATDISNGVLQAGAKPAEYTTTDICDGIAQAHGGMNFPLASREFIANMVEIHARATPFDALVLSSAGDKAVPAHLIAIARLNIPAVHVPGGAMASGPELRSNEALWSMSGQVERGELDRSEFEAFQQLVCPGCGACQYMGTAATMQIMSEALGLALPWSALVPAGMAELRRMARAAGVQVVSLLRDGVTSRSILTRAAFENAAIVHAAIGGSLNGVMHLLAIAREARVALTATDIHEIHQRTPVLVDAKTAGRYPTELFWYAGGVPQLMTQLAERLNLDVLTATGTTLGENLERLSGSAVQKAASRFLGNYHVNPRDVIHTIDRPVYSRGSTVLLRGNLASGALVKSHAVAPAMMKHTGRARVFNDERSAIASLKNGKIQPGDVIVVRFQGPKANGMPEMFFLSELIASDPQLASTTALVTDGRFSGATRGPCIGYVYPEAIDGGAIAHVQNDDLISIDIDAGTIDVTGIGGAALDPAVVQATVQDRQRDWSPPNIQHSGALGHFAALASPALEGASMRTTADHV